MWTTVVDSRPDMSLSLSLVSIQVTIIVGGVKEVLLGKYPTMGCGLGCQNLSEDVETMRAVCKFLDFLPLSSPLHR